VVVCDLSSLQSVREAAQSILNNYTHLDVLINNAAVVMDTRVLTVDGHEMMFGTNHLGPFLLTSMLLPLLKISTYPGLNVKSGREGKYITPQSSCKDAQGCVHNGEAYMGVCGGRVVNVSSAAHSFVSCVNFDDLNYAKGFSTFPVYGHSKLCNILFSRELAKRLLVDEADRVSAGTAAQSAHTLPGTDSQAHTPTDTDSQAHTSTDTESQAHTHTVLDTGVQTSNPLSESNASSRAADSAATDNADREIKSHRPCSVSVSCLHPGAVATNLGANSSTWYVKPVISVLSLFFKAPEKGAESSVYLATQPQGGACAGEYFIGCKVAGISKGATDDAAAKRLWEVSERLVGIAE
ncbi:hypothetical protein SARC_09368, partial [Sphaeroforma arctica JP610]